MSYQPNKRSRATFEKEDVSPYMIYGTPIPKPDPKSREQDPNLPVWKQEVLDERGRKRLHGAFTGGYSAGYFNTVGSKEGWTPATFTSSRTNRAKVTALKPEDFMDDEDRADAQAEEDRRLEREREAAAAAGTGSTAEELAAQGLTNTAKLFEMLGTQQSVDEFPLGKAMMQKLGWREGTGIGPKVRRKVRDQEGEGGEEDFKTYFFLPDEVKVPEYPLKTDRKGLGYTGELRTEDGELEKPLLKPKAVLKKPNVKLGMGVGIFNDDGEDDEDIYEIKPKSAYNKTLGGDKKKKKASTTATTPTGAVASPVIKAPARHVFVSKKDNQARSKMRRCRDGTLPLEGYILDDKPFWPQWDKKYPLPEVPKGWVPKRLLADPAKYAAATTTTTNTQAKAAPLSIKARGALLGEKPEPGKSVFDFLTPAARERLASATGKNNLPQAKGEMVDTGKDAMQKAKDAIPYLEKDVAANALKGFLPYADAPEKRARYRMFLEITAGIRNGMPVRDKGVSLEDWARELNEFAHAARIFKPVTGLMANRFTSSSSMASQLPTTGGSKNLETEETLISRPAAKAEDPAITAAKMGMYGAMTRSVIQFYPTRLLCKRFNVAPPVHVDPVGEEEAKIGKDVELVGKREMDRLMLEANTNADWRGLKKVGFESVGKEGGDDGAEGVGEGMELDHEPVEKVNTYRNPTLEGPRAGDEVFKAIFGDDSEEEDD